MSRDPLLQPYTLKHLVLKNRIMSTAHEPAYSESGMPGERYRLYHREKARGGMALTMTAGSALVSPDSPPAFGNLLAYKDEIVAPLAALVADCHEHDCKVMIQLTHLGRRTAWNTGDWLPVVSASSVREPAHRAIPKAAEDWDIARIIADYADAAARMQAAGLDGIELEAYGHLMDSFWSPRLNQRDDGWNGALDARLRFAFEVIAAIRRAVGAEFIVGIRMVADEMVEGGISRAEGVQIAQRIAASGQLDFINLIRGNIDSDASLTKVIPIAGMASAPHLDFAGDLRAATKFPLFHAARIADVATARHAVATGKLDMVGMTRAHLADPHISAKVMAGDEARIRPCVGATYCLDRIYENGEALCIHNAATGREAVMPHVIARSERPRRVVVVGAGPAGLEAARVAGARGHDVVVLEAAAQPGGQVNLLAKNPRRRELAGIIDWRLSELEAMNVLIKTEIYAEAEDVLALSPDMVVIATGGVPQTPPMAQGAELAASSWDILGGTIKPSQSVLVYDDLGGHQGMSAAEFLAQAGSQVALVSPERFFAPEVGGMNHAPYMAAFQRHGVRLRIAMRLEGIRRVGNQLEAAFVSDYEPGWREVLTVDQVVVEHGTAPAEDLYFELKPLSRNLGAVDHKALTGKGNLFPEVNAEAAFALYRIGDATASRNIHAAIYDALRYGIRW